MKKLIIFLIAFCTLGFVQAQPPTQDPYPNVPAAATNINQYNFYIDSVSTLNEQQKPFGATNNNTVAPSAISLAGVISGVHQLYVKVVDVIGKPSIINVGNFYVEGDNLYQNAPPSSTNINKYSFYIDSISTINEQINNFAATNNNTTAPPPINLAGVTTGVHQLYAKVTDVAGKPSIINVGNFYMDGDNLYQNAPLAATNINKYSFYIDSVSNVNEQVNNFAATSSNAVAPPPISLAAVISGVHQLYAKVTDVAGKPSIINFGNFYMEGDNLFQNVPAAAANINRYEFFVDSVSTLNIQPLGFAASANNTTPNTSIDLTAVLPGVHYLYARVFDVNNKPSILNVGSFAMDQIFKYQNEPTVAPALQNMEYFVDNDPGYGLATPISFAANNNIVITNLNIAIPTTLGIGLHNLHVRSKQNPWSIDNAIIFNIGAPVPLQWSYINAKLQDAQTLVSWGTEQEVNTAKFEIERSIDGIHFVKIGELLAEGNSSTSKAYNFMDTKPAIGFNYYRIKQIDLNGMFTYSIIVKVINTKNIKDAFIAPNPVAEVLNLIEPVTVFIETIEVYDSKSALLLQKKIGANVQLYSLPVNSLVKGSYILKVNYGTHTKTIMFVK